MSLERDITSPHVPSLWYYDLLSFLDALPMHSNSNANTPTEHYFNFNRFKNKIYLEKRKKKSLKRLREEAKSVQNEAEESRPGYINIEPLQSSEEVGNIIFVLIGHHHLKGQTMVNTFV